MLPFIGHDRIAVGESHPAVKHLVLLPDTYTTATVSSHTCFQKPLLYIVVIE